MSDDLAILDEIPDWFWQQIDLARADRERFRQAVREMSRDDLIGFAQTYDLAAAEFRAEYYVEHVAPGLSEDSIDDIASWIVAQGRDHYVQVLCDPRQMPTRVDSFDPALGIPSEVHREYHRRYQESLILL